MPTAHDLSMLDGDELSARLGESRRELFNLRFQLATGQLDNPARIGQVRREVARMLTVLRGREILEAEGGYVAPTAAEHEAARAKLAAEDAEREEKAAARTAAAEAETPEGPEDEVHDHDLLDEHDQLDDDDQLDDYEVDDEEDEA
jgi:large subunit ribosomal protein L29